MKFVPVRGISAEQTTETVRKRKRNLMAAFVAVFFTPGQRKGRAVSPSIKKGYKSLRFGLELCGWPMLNRRNSL